MLLGAARVLLMTPLLERYAQDRYGPCSVTVCTDTGAAVMDSMWAILASGGESCECKSLADAACAFSSPVPPTLSMLCRHGCTCHTPTDGRTDL